MGNYLFNPETGSFLEPTVPHTPTPTESSTWSEPKSTQDVQALADHQEAVHARKQALEAEQKLRDSLEIESLNSHIAKAAEQKEHVLELIKDKAKQLTEDVPVVQARHELYEKLDESRKKAEFRHHQQEQDMAAIRKQSIIEGIKEKQYGLQHHGQSPQ